MRDQLTLALLVLCTLRVTRSAPKQTVVTNLTTEEVDALKTRLETTEGLINDKQFYFRVMFVKDITVKDNYGGRDYKFSDMHIGRTDCLIVDALVYVGQGRRVLEGNCPFAKFGTTYKLSGKMHRDRKSGCYTVLYPVKVQET